MQGINFSSLHRVSCAMLSSPDGYVSSDGRLCCVQPPPVAGAHNWNWGQLLPAPLPLFYQHY